jgi:hypothetical protein
MSGATTIPREDRFVTCTDWDGYLGFLRGVGEKGGRVTYDWKQVIGAIYEDEVFRPDLAIEVEISRSVLDRLSIYEALEIPELCRLDSEGYVSAWVLTENGYIESEDSRHVPGAPFELMNRFMERVDEEPPSRLVREFRKIITAQEI